MRNFPIIFPNIPKSEKGISPSLSPDSLQQADFLQSRSAKTFEFKLQDERYISRTAPEKPGNEITFTFKIPPWDVLAASANRLLKFEFPAIRDIKVYERLIKTNMMSTGVSKKVLETLSVPSLEQIYREMWQHSLKTMQVSPLDNLLSLFLLVEEMEEFEPGQMLLQDIALMGQRDPGTMHSYYYRDALNRTDQISFLAGHGYRTDFFEEVRPDPIEALPENIVPAESQENKDRQRNATAHKGLENGLKLELAYFACRRLSAPLPWTGLLMAFEQEPLRHREKFPRLMRLHKILGLLKKQHWAVAPITPAHLLSTVHRLRKLSQKEKLAGMAAQFGFARPVKELVIVEGETERLLLPLFAEAMGYHFNHLGIDTLPAGGKTHVLALYREYKRNLKVPICILLDNDAQDVADELSAILRPQDQVIRIEEGEFEDTYDLALLLQTINDHYQPFPEITPESFQKLTESHPGGGRVQGLKTLWQSYNLGSFDKIEFAARYAEMFRPATADQAQKQTFVQPSETVQAIIRMILTIRENHQHILTLRKP